MCTTGAVATTDSRGEPVIYVLKTSDYKPSGIWHGIIEGNRGNDILGCNRWEVAGVSAGMNKRGLAVLRSFLDYRGPFDQNINPQDTEEDFPFELDPRSAMAAATLERYCSVDEALSYLLDIIPKYFKKRSKQRGGSFILVDERGEVAVVECCEERLAWKLYPDGFTARGNNGLLILHEEQRSLPDLVREDREIRYQHMLKILQGVHDSTPRGMNKNEVLEQLKTAMSWHGPAGKTVRGAICAHGIQAAGARTNSQAPVWTLSGVIFDVVEKIMHYVAGNPCQAAWRELSF